MNIFDDILPILEEATNNTLFSAFGFIPVMNGN